MSEETFPWDKAAARGLSHLQTLLRFPTINPPGNERVAAEFIAAQLRKSGLEPEILERAPERSNVVCRIRGTTDEGPLLLTGHTDVVPVELEHWNHPPFEAEIHGGYLFGRGAIDMKNHVAACLLMMQLLAERGIKPRRDVIFAAVADEEEGCQYGSRFLVEEHPEKVRAEWMMGELGGYPLALNGVRYYPIQIAEKGQVFVRMTARGKPGHGSMPHREMAATRLGKALELLGRSMLPIHVVEPVRNFLEILKQTQPSPQKWAIGTLLNPKIAPTLCQKVLPAELGKSFGAVLSNTVSTTRLEGGFKNNMIPSSFSALLDGRLLPGQTGDDLVRELRELLGDDLIFETWDEALGFQQDTPDSPLYRTICETLKKYDPEGVPLPYMIPGFTDAQYFHRLGTRCYGFTPMYFPPEDNVKFMDLFHGHNERIHVEGYQWGLRVLWDVVSKFVL